MIIDCHAHITENGSWFNTSFDSSVENLLHQMDQAGIDRSILLPIKGSVSHEYISRIVHQYNDRLIGFGSISVKTWQQDLNDCKRYSFKGVKFHPRLQNETLLELSEAGVLEELGMNKLTLIICGWQQTSASRATMKTLTPVVLDTIAKKYPSVTFIMAHMGGHNFWDAFFCARSNANVFLDCSYFLSFFKNTSLESDFWAMYKKIDEKVVFGSDFPEISIPEIIQYINTKSIEFGIDTSKLYFANISKILGL